MRGFIEVHSKSYKPTILLNIREIETVSENEICMVSGTCFKVYESYIQIRGKIRRAMRLEESERITNSFSQINEW